MHHPKIDITTPEGECIGELHSRIREEFGESDGWNGGDLVEIVEARFHGMGIDPDSDDPVPPRDDLRELAAVAPDTATDATPVVDRTGLSCGTFYLGGPNGRGGSFTTPGAGRLYSARPDGHGSFVILRYGTPVSNEDTAALLDYLTGPRRVVVSIWRRGTTAHDDQQITEHTTVVADGPHPDDYNAWTGWLTEHAAKWLAEHSAEPGRYHVCAADTRAAQCSGWRGLWPLGRSVDLTRATAIAERPQDHDTTS